MGPVETRPTRVEIFSVRDLANGKIPDIPDQIETVYLPNFERSLQTDIEKAIDNTQAKYPRKNIVPYIPVRKYNVKEAQSLLTVYANKGIKEIVVLAGGKFSDLKDGNFEDTASFLQRVNLKTYGIHTIGVAAHPEHHFIMSNPDRINCLKQKYTLATEQGLTMYLITQCIGNPARFVQWEQEVRGLGIDANIYYGTPLPKMSHAFYKKFIDITQAITHDPSHPDFDAEALLRVNTPNSNDLGKVLAELNTQNSNRFQGFHFYIFGDNVQEGLKALSVPYTQFTE